MTRLFAVASILLGGALGILGLAGAPASAEEVHLTVTQWVRPEVRGKFTGQVVVPVVGGVRAVEGAQVKLLSGSGSVFSGVSDSNGDVTITGVGPGVYALWAQAEGLTAIYAMHIAGAEHAAAGLLPSTAVIPCAEVPLSKVQEFIGTYVVNRYSRAVLKLDQIDIAGLGREILGNEQFETNRAAGSLEGYLFAAADGWATGDDPDQHLDPAEMMNVVERRPPSPP
jgi:hypothetical protein